MNPAIAKLTPLLLEYFEDSFAESGITVSTINVSAMDSWVQFFKNLPIGLLAFVFMNAAIFTKEFNTGTLILPLTKGLARYKTVICKSCVLVFLWTFYYFLCFFITYLYNSYYWDNGIAKNLVFSVLCWWLFGIFIISLLILFSVISNQSSGVLMGTGAVLLISFVLSFIPKANKYLPILLTDGNSLIYGAKAAQEYAAAVIITAAASFLCFLLSIPIFNKKQL
jgi:ABC-2 type transport system permease protein